MFLINTYIIHRTTIAKHFGYSIMHSFTSHAILSVVHNLHTCIRKLKTLERSGNTHLVCGENPKSLFKLFNQNQNQE
jgi:hypothetical protein